jgi:hypothetical protein
MVALAYAIIVIKKPTQTIIFQINFNMDIGALGDGLLALMNIFSALMA